MDIEEELRALRKTVARNTDSNEKMTLEMRKVSAIGETIKGHETFLQELVKESFTHQRKQDDKVLDFLLGKLGWILTVIMGAALGLKVTGVI